MSGIVFDTPHPSRGQVHAARRAYDALGESRRTLVGAEAAIRAAVAKYMDAANADADERSADAASAPLLAVEVVDQVLGLLDVVGREIREAHAHQQAAVHSMQRQQRRGDAADVVIGQLVWALTARDERVVEAAATAGVHHLLGPSRLIDRSIAEVEAYVEAKRRAARPVAELVAVSP